MCAINPKFQKHFRLSVYTSNPKVTEKEFQEAVLFVVTSMERRLNKSGLMRWHVNEEDPPSTESPSSFGLGTKKELPEGGVLVPHPKSKAGKELKEKDQWEHEEHQQEHEEIMREIGH